MPDEVFGERVCLYAELEPGPTLELDDARHVPRATGASRPSGSRSGWSCVDALPRASGGKVAKGELRADIRRRLGVEA